MVPGHPRARVQTLHVVPATHGGGNQFVVLLQDLVTSGGVDVGELLDPEELFLHRLQRRPRGLRSRRAL